MNMVFERKLTIPAEVKEMHPLTKEVVNTVETKRQEIKNVFAGKDNRLLLIIGPCSADKEESVLDYINRLKPVQEKVKDKIFRFFISKGFHFHVVEAVYNRLYTEELDNYK